MNYGQELRSEPKESLMNYRQTPADAFISICSRNPIAVLTISDLLTKSSFRWGVMKFFAGPLPLASHGLQIAVVDVPSIPEWPELVARWTSEGCRTILLMAERLDFRSAELRALRLGVSGIVRIAAKFAEELGSAIAVVAAGHLYVKDEALDSCRRGFELRDTRSCDPDLSFREEQVLDLVMLGYTNRRIGTLLGISERTAKFHVCNILHKLNVKRRKDVFGIGRGFLELRQTKECSVQHIDENNLGLHPVRISTV